MSTEVIDHGPQLPPRLCGCYIAGVPCLDLADWHYRIELRGKTETAYACHAHHRIALPLSFDHHRVGDACGEHGHVWVPRSPGESFCHLPEDTTEQHEQIVRLTSTMQPA